MPTRDGPHGDEVEIIGRLHEQTVIRALLEDRRPFTTAVLVDGEAGLGKTALWRAARARASGAGLQTLAVEAAEREQDLPLVTLGDLLAGQPWPGSDESDPLVLGRCVVALLERLADSRPTLIAIDDVQWLDDASERVLSFAVRRVAHLPFRLLLTRRIDGQRTLPLGLDRQLGDDRLVRVRLGGLEVSELDAMLRRRLGVRLSRPRLVELHGMTHGNPLHALEIVRSSLADGRRPGEVPFVVPPSLADAVGEGVSELSAEARWALVVVAAAGSVSAELLESALGATAGVRAAIEAGALELDGDRVRARHPLVATAAYESALPSERRDAHRCLADIVPDTVDRARHRAFASTAADAAVAGDLEASAELAARRGAPALGAFLAERSAALTPAADADGRRRRLRVQAEHRIAAGDPATARALLEQLADEASPGRERATVLLLLADTVGDDLRRSIELAERALAEGAGDPALAAQAHTALGVYTWLAGDIARATEHCRASSVAAAESGDERLLAISLGELCHAEAVLGTPWSRDAMSRALDIERRLDRFPPWVRPSFQLGIILTYTDRPEEARQFVVAELDRMHALGDEAGRVGVLFRLAELELRAGNWGRAAAAASEAMSLADQAGIEQEQTTASIAHALVSAHLGDLDGARTVGERCLAVAESMGDRIVATRARGVLGLVEVSAGRPADALMNLEPALADLRAMGIGELSIAAVPENLVDALVAVGRLDDAAAVCETTAAAGHPAGRAWHAAVAARGRALVASARGDHGAACLALEEAYAAHARLPNPFTLARTHLVAGIAARRSRRWADARRAFTDALDLFDHLGAARWADRAGNEIGRLPGRAPSRGGLTETERAVAELVATGLPNKAIAARLAVSTRTVEQRVTRIYQKLGVGSRVELVRHLDAVRPGAQSTDGGAPRSTPPRF